MNSIITAKYVLIRVSIYIMLFSYFCFFSAISSAEENLKQDETVHQCRGQHHQHDEKDALDKHDGHNHTHSTKHEHEHKHRHQHKSFHDGKLFEIGSCENGHCEIKLNENGTVELWLVGGGNNTGNSIRTSAEEIKFKCKLKNGLKNDEFDLILKAAPIELAEESAGDCSYFTGHHEKLAGKNISFFANGNIYFKGKNIKVEIDY